MKEKGQYLPMKKNVVEEKSYAFALRIVKLYRWLCEEKREYVLSKQLLRSGTSIGANVEEAIGGMSEKDFSAKMIIAYKEARESHYWLRLLYDSEFIDQAAFESIIGDCNELLKLLESITKTMKTKIRNS
jgi:four helix bundle protein